MLCQFIIWTCYWHNMCILCQRCVFSSFIALLSLVMDRKTTVSAAGDEICIVCVCHACWKSMWKGTRSERFMCCSWSRQQWVTDPASSVRSSRPASTSQSMVVMLYRWVVMSHQYATADSTLSLTLIYSLVFAHNLMSRKHILSGTCTYNKHTTWRQIIGAECNYVQPHPESLLGLQSRRSVVWSATFLLQDEGQHSNRGH